MVIVDTSFKKMQSLLKGNISIEELEKTLADMGMELDCVEGDEIKVEITAERTDLITPEGLARAINCYCGFTKEYQEIKVIKGDYIHKVESSVKPYRPATRSFVVKGLQFTDENIKALMWIQEKLHDTYGRKRKKVAIGVYELSKINFPVTYLAKTPEEIKFIPLGMEQSLNGRQILQRHPTGRDYAHLLEGFDKYPLQIDSKGQVLSLPPIINSDNLGKIDITTKDIFVECTGPDEDALDSVMSILATMFNDWGGKIYSVIIEDEGKNHVCPNMKAGKRTISLNLIKNLIGLDLNSEKASELLRKMGYNIIETKKEKEKQDKAITVSIPSVRTDVWHEVDIADDVARGYGYNNITPTMPNIATIGEMLPKNILIEDLCNFLTGLNLIEVKTFALTNHQDQYKKMNIEEEKHISLGKNTQDKNLSMVRSWLLPEAIKALVANRSSEYPQRIFEVGTVVIPDKTSDVKARNVEKLVVLLCEEKVDFTKIKQILDVVMNFLGKKYQTKETQHNSFIEGRVGEIIVTDNVDDVDDVVNEKKIGFVGELNPTVLVNWEMQMPIAALEIDLQKIFETNK